MGFFDRRSPRKTPTPTPTPTPATAPATSVSKASLGLDRVDNTRDLEKPVSAATREELDALANNVGTQIRAAADDLARIRAMVEQLPQVPSTGGDGVPALIYRDVGHLRFSDFGADPKGERPNDVPLLEVMDYLKRIARNAGRTYHFASSPLHTGAGDFRFDGTVELHQVVKLTGHGMYATKFHFPAGKTGLITGRDRSRGEHEYVPNGGQGNSGGSTISGIGFFSAGGERVMDSPSVGSGILARAAVNVMDCHIEGFPNNGVAVVASVEWPEHHNVYGEASECRVERSVIWGNKNHGVLAQGADVNVMGVENCRIGANGGWGIWNKDAGPFLSKLNHYVTNGKMGTAGNTATSVVYNKGKMWGLNFWRPLADGSAVEPHVTTDQNAVWIEIRDMTSAPADIPQWSPELPLRHGGAGVLSAFGSKSDCDYLEGTQNALWVKSGMDGFGKSIVCPRGESARFIYC